MKFDRNKTLIACLLVLLSWQGLALGAEAPLGLPLQPLTLNDAISYALVHNRSYLAAKQEVDSVGQQVRQARADFLSQGGRQLHLLELEGSTLRDF